MENLKYYLITLSVFLCSCSDFLEKSTVKALGSYFLETKK